MFNISQKVDVPTHRLGHTLDWVILQNGDNCVKAIEIENNRVISDHFLIFIDLNVKKPKKEKKTVESRKIKDIVFTDFYKDLEFSFKDFDQNKDIEIFNSKLISVFDKHAPLEKRNIIERPFSNWYNLEIKEAKTERRKKGRQWKKSGLTVHKDIFNSACRLVNKLIVCAKKTFFIKKFQCLKTSKDLFSNVNILFRKKSNSSLQDLP